MQKENQFDYPTSLQDIFCRKNVSSFFSWSIELEKWIPEEIVNSTDFFADKSVFENYLRSKTNRIQQQLTSVTLNVLFDFRSSSQPDKDRGHMKFSNQRYRQILVQLEKMDCDMITLNEMTRPFVKIIQETDWIRKSYTISTVHNSTISIQCFGNLILTKLKPLALHIFKIPHLPRPISIEFFLVQRLSHEAQNQKLQKRSVVTFSSIHLTAYDKNFQRREKQLTSIKQYLDSFNGCVDQHILQGDMNFHSENENFLAKNLNLQDCWLQVYKIKNEKDLEQNPGYTFDSIANFFTKELYWGFEKRRMRLDRIFCSTHTKNVLTPKQIIVVFNKPIYSQSAQEPSYNIFKSGICFLTDMLKFNIFRSKEKYLFCSDHFGLFCKFQLNV